MSSQEILMAVPVDMAGGEAAFDALLDAERRRLYGIAFAILGDHGEAEDALQEAMVRAWRSWTGLRNNAAGPAWLTRICVNHCINRRRSAQRRGAWGPPLPTHAAPEHPRLAGRLVDLDHSYRRLSPRQRAAIVLHYHHGYSVDECAALMRCRPGSVRTHLARALASMRKEMTHA